MEHVPGSAVFDALAEAIGILRADAAEPDPRDAIREAHMRKVLRRAVRDGFERIAVVCGAWHVPALRDLPPAVADDRLLRGLPKVKASLTWVPWTYGRLSYASGYGAGIRSPGWYDHLFCSPGQPVERWLAKAAAVLRDEGIPASSAHVIESVRLAEALDAGRITTDEAGVRMSRALSAAAPAPAAAGWAEGFLAGSGLLLVHDDKLLALADGWLAGLSADAFAAVLPALRRTFGGFAPPERRAIGQQAARLDGSGRRPAVVASATDDLDSERAALAASGVALILGLTQRAAS